MNSKQIVTTLGYIAIFCIALYFAFGILKISGQGLSSMGFNGDIIEGMTDKEKDKAEENIEKANEKIEKELENIKESDRAKSLLNMDDLEGFEDFKDNITLLVQYNVEVKKNMLLNTFLEKMKKSSRISFSDKAIKNAIDELLTLDKLAKFLENHEDIDI